jgi:FkbM family methyltransferase
MFTFNKAEKKYSKASFSQCGEDLIIDYVFRMLKIEKPEYWDIGAYHPYNISNTAFFYEKGCRGLNVEPNPELYKLFKKHRPEDINVNAGVAVQKGSGEYYMMDIPSLNTFSQEHVNDYLKEGHQMIKKVNLSLLTLHDISRDFYNGKWPDILTVDVEGLDFDLLNSISYKEKLSVICVETITYSTTGRGEKNQKVIDLLIENGYFLYADTYINSIFVKKSHWLQG